MPGLSYPSWSWTERNVIEHVGYYDQSHLEDTPRLSGDSHSRLVLSAHWL
jgi:hypothetical protein